MFLSVFAYCLIHSINYFTGILCFFGEDCSVMLQAENSNLEKADILELTVSQLRHMVANTEMQCVYGYSACVQEVNDFLVGIRYDDVTRRRIVQHLCRRRPSMVPLGGRRVLPTSALRRVPPDVESTSGDGAEHLRMFSYSSADSTTDGATEPCEAGSTVINNNTDDASTSCKREVVGEITDSNTTAACFDGGEDMALYTVESTDDAIIPAVIDAHARAADADETGCHLENAHVLSPVWRPW